LFEKEYIIITILYKVNYAYVHKCILNVDVHKIVSAYINISILNVLVNLKLFKTYIIVLLLIFYCLKYYYNYILFSTSVGFKDPEFCKEYSKNSYSIEIHSRTNAIGLPISAEVKSSQKTLSISLINKSVFFQRGLSQNNSRIKVDYVPKSWQLKSIPLIGVTGKKLIVFFSNLYTYLKYK